MLGRLSKLVLMSFYRNHIDQQALFIYLFIYLFIEMWSYCVAQASLELKVLLPQPPECWDYRCVPPCLAAL
jgi:hypothetical protein